MVFGPSFPYKLGQLSSSNKISGKLTPCSIGLSATSQQYFSLTTNQPPATSQQYFSLRINQHQLSATSQTNRLLSFHRPLKKRVGIKMIMSL
jgi:hypothetical protein